LLPKTLVCGPSSTWSLVVCGFQADPFGALHLAKIRSCSSPNCTPAQVIVQFTAYLLMANAVYRAALYRLCTELCGSAPSQYSTALFP